MKLQQIVEEAISNKKMLTDNLEQSKWRDSLEFRIKEYARLKCKEQREICDECFQNGLMKMEQAPEPKMDEV